MITRLKSLQLFLKDYLEHYFYTIKDETFLFSKKSNIIVIEFKKKIFVLFIFINYNFQNFYDQNNDNFKVLNVIRIKSLVVNQINTNTVCWLITCTMYIIYKKIFKLKKLFL